MIKRMIQNKGKGCCESTAFFTSKIRYKEVNMQKKHTGWMAIISILALCISVMVKQPILAAQPLSIALCLDHDVMKQGEEMKVSVALQNYDDSYKDNVITTMIVEVSVNTDQLSVNEDTIQVDLDEGKGMAFSMAKLKGSNVELQYLNVSDPLKKGTKDLYSFTVTAQTDIEDLKKCLNISYVAVQDGSKAESEKLTAVPVVILQNMERFSQKKKMSAMLSVRLRNRREAPEIQKTRIIAVIAIIVVIALIIAIAATITVITAIAVMITAITAEAILPAVEKIQKHRNQKEVIPQRMRQKKNRTAKKKAARIRKRIL